MDNTVGINREGRAYSKNTHYIYTIHGIIVFQVCICALIKNKSKSSCIYI